MKVVTHVLLGECLVDDVCEAMNKLNADPTSVFVLHDGEYKEVTKALVDGLETEE